MLYGALRVFCSLGIFELVMGKGQSIMETRIQVRLQRNVTTDCRCRRSSHGLLCKADQGVKMLHPLSVFTPTSAPTKRSNVNNLRFLSAL